MNMYMLAADTIKSSVSALDVASVLGWEVRGGRCKCPIHNGGDYNCVLYKGNRGFHCFSCGASGDVISLVQQYYKYSFKDCIAWFNDTFHLGLDIDSPLTKEQQREAKIALQRRKNAIEFQQWKERMQFDLTLLADDIVRRLEDVRDDKRPRTYGDWDKDFCEAVKLLPEARRFADDCMMNCTEVKE